MKALIIIEHDNNSLKPSVGATITAAAQVAETVEAIVFGTDCNPAAQALAKYTQIHKILVADNQCFQGFLAEPATELLQELANNYDYVVAPATTFGKNILPRLAAKLDVAPVTDIIQIIDAETFVRPIYAGNAIATVKCAEKTKLLSIRPTNFATAAAADNNAAIENLSLSITNQHSEFIELQESEHERPDLTAANIVISGGRGLQSAENFKLLEQLADKLGAAIGASRAAVDAGFVPNDYQVGQTGKVVAPDLYIAVGISGAIQHLAGIKDSKVIVAINKDPDAPIFNVADYGLVGDLFEILPDLLQQLP